MFINAVISNIEFSPIFAGESKWEFPFNSIIMIKPKENSQTLLRISSPGI